MEDSTDQPKAALQINLLKCEMTGLKDSLGKFISGVELRLEFFSALRDELVSKLVLTGNRVDIYNEFFSYISSEMQRINTKMIVVEEQTENISKSFYSVDEDDSVFESSNVRTNKNTATDSGKADEYFRVLDEEEELSNCEHTSPVGSACKSDSEQRNPELKPEISPLKKPKSLNLVRCHLCKGFLKNALNLKRHMKKMHYSEEMNGKFEDNGLVENGGKEHKKKNARNEKANLVSCNLCKKTLKSQISLKRHMKKMHDFERLTVIEKYENDVAENLEEKDNDSDNSIAASFISEENQPIYECQECGSTFKNHGSLRRHRKSIHFIDASDGSISKKKYKSRKPFKNNSSEERCICEICGLSTTKGSAKRHMLTHSGVKPYSCSICDKKFATLSGKDSHLRSHTGERPFLCGTCGASFTASTNLRGHMLTHSGIKPYKCDQCPLQFYMKSQLKKHKRNHSSERPYKCKFCPASYKQPSVLAVHVRSHTNERPYACSFCGKRFSNSTSLKEHENIHLGIRFTCEGCNQTYSKKTGLMTHLKNKRDTCYKVFLAKKELDAKLNEENA